MSTWSEHLAPGTLAIFLLHGVVAQAREGVRNYTHKHLELERFESLCRELGDAGNAVDADTAVAMLRGDQPMVDRAFLLSFDDGFANNLTIAAPVMADLGIGGVFYVTSGFVDGNGASWTDLIEDAVERTSRRHLRLPWSPEAWPLGTRAQRIALLDEVRRVVKTRRDLDPYAVADHVREEASTGAFVADPQLDRKLTWEEVRGLDAGEGFTVGGHSHTHRILAYLPAEELKREINTSMDLLQSALGRPVRHYSYPEGLDHCYSDAVIAALKERGVVCAPTAEPGVNRVGDDLFRLRRITVV